MGTTIKAQNAIEALTASFSKSTSFVIDTRGEMSSFSLQNIYAVLASTAKTFIAGVKAALVIQDITYTAVSGYGPTGNAISIAYTGGATAGAEVVTVVGSAITVQIATGVSTATQVKAAWDAKAEAVALATAAITGTAGNAQVIAAAASLTGGTGDVDIANNLIRLPAHGWPTGRKVAASNPGTLPAPLTATDYYVIRNDADTIKLATNHANALAGTAIDLTTVGVGTTTLTPAALGTTTVKVQESNVDQDSAYKDLSGVTTTISADGSSIFKPDLGCRYLRYVLTMTDGAGAISLAVYQFGKG